ncbi:formylglycine-generating enzyme family protein [Sulfurovum sp. CS9]|uniref:formylglycine-generating enzyme family protein n=1 Tax=Sulfurovum sp. CS9 TaxID=3391146 RepID=UPI0039E73BD0
MIFIVWLNIAQAANSKPDNSLVLPMPNGLTMEFMPVCVNPNSGLFDWKKIKLGDPSGGFKEYPTTMALGGSFPIEKNGKKMWCYYIGKYELTKKQYASLITPEKPLHQNKKAYPVTNISWFDALEFGNLYNQWLFAHAKEKIPKFDTSYGFVRLPTEAEWEFAARGGSAVSADFFDQKIPYSSDKIQKYEWFGGPTSSHYKLQPVGVLKPNPLGLHDMLGNADEITMSLFSVEYYQGRTGGFVIKGNNYTTAKNKLRSAFRTEQPFYRLDKEGLLKPHTKKTLGFRLVISALVFPSRKIQKEMSDEWEGYRSQLGATTPAALSTSATSVKVTAGGEDAFSYLDRLKKRLKQKGLVDSEIENSLGYLDSSIRNMATIRLKAEEDSAYLWVKVGSEQARFVRKETQKLPILDTLISIADSQNDIQKLEKYETRKKEHTTNIAGALSSYSDSIRQISTLSPQAVKKGFTSYLDFLMSRNDGEQVQVLNRVQKHFGAYQKNKRVNLKQWERDIMF